VDPDITFSHAEELVVSIGSRPHDSPGNLSTRNYILDTFTDYGLDDPHLHAFSGGTVQDGANVVATVPGTTYPEHIFLIGAHHDSIPGGVGSIDNATGVATLLEIARYFSQHPPDYTLRFVTFDAEEIGLVGSGHYYEDSLDELESTRMMLCLDMTQTNESSPLSPLIAFVLSSHPALAETFVQVRDELGLGGSGVFNITVELAKLVSGGDLRSDIRHWEGDPLLLAWPWALSLDYHPIPGSIQQIDKTGLAVSTKFVLEFVRRLQAYSPDDLQVQAVADVPVDKEMLQLLRERGGIKPLHE
jgi:hypothetical protein